VSVGGDHTCGVRANGKLYCWGADAEGQVGNGGESSEPVIAPRRIGTFEDWAYVATGGSHTCGVRRNGKLYCWGSDGAGQVGDGDATAATAPRRIGTFEDWATAGAGYAHSCGVRTNGKLYCWGSDEFGQVGDGDAVGNSTVPRRIGTFEDWATADGGYGHSCGVRKNGKLYCWGSDNFGQVGDGDNPTEAAAPRRIGTFEDWANVSALNSHTCGTRRNGKLYCWGYDTFGQIGDGGDNVNALAPLRIGTFEDWTTVSAGNTHTCGVRRNGKLYCWGVDDEGEVGDGVDESTKTAPLRI
jgi:alpha-tubulin suppressor-like RCC1 family protein